MLDTDDVSEGAGNLYFTNAKARGAISGTGPISYNSGTGVIDCPTCVTTSGNGNIVAGTGASISGTLTGRLIGSGNVTFGVSSDVPTSVVNDTNVTGSISANALTLSWTGQLSASRGGTGVNGSGATNGQLLIGNGSGYSLATLTGAGPVGITNSAGGISIDCSTCVTTSGNGNITSSGGDITLGGTTTGRLIGAGNVNYDLSTTGVVGATYGSANQVATFTVDSKGRLTSASSTAIALNASAITAGTLSVTRGGTGVDGSGATNGQLLIGNGSGYSLSTLSSSGPIGITNSAGGISVGCSTCVTTGTTLFTAAGDLGVNQSVTSGQTVTFVGGVGLTTTGSATRNITVDLDNTAVAAASYGTASSVGSFTVDAQGRITNASNTAIAISASAITAGTLSVTRGGTGVDGSGATNGQLLIGNGTGYSLATITAGSGISVTNGAGSISIANTGAAATCGATTNYVCNNGNTLGAALNIGTTDSNILTLGTGNTTRFTVSSGAATLTGNGATTLTSSGAMTLNSASATALGIDSGTTGAINIGTGASSKTITIGNTTGTTGINIDSGSGNINLRPGGSGTTANVQIGAGGAGSTTPDLLVLDRKSDAGDPTGTNGAMYYNSSTNKFRCFENSAWANCITVSGGSSNTKSVTKLANETTTSDTTLSNDTELKFNIGANETWSYRFVIQVNSPTPADMKFAITAPVGASCQATATSYKNNNSISQLGCGVSSGLMSTSATDEMIEVTGSVTNGANAGTINVQWAQNTSNAGTTTVYKGSFVNAFKETGADLAEIYYTHDSAQPGEVVSLDSSMKAGVRKSSGSYDSTVLGVISTKPGYVLADSEGSDPTALPVALALSGRVPVKISDENGVIKAGDPLTSSSTSGVAMKATRSGWVIGVAMEDQTVGIDNVMTFVNRSWYGGDGDTKVPSLTGLTMTDDGLAGIEKEQLNQMQDGLSSNNPELVSQALGILKDIQGTVVGQQTKYNELEARLNSQQVAQAVFNGGVVTEDSTFKGKVVFEALTTFNGSIVFSGDAKFAGNTVFDKVISQSKDQAGTATIPAGSTSARVTFSVGAYTKSPIVTATPVGEEALLDLKYSIIDVSEDGFTIVIKPEQLQDIKFNYIVAQTQ